MADIYHAGKVIAGGGGSSGSGGHVILDESHSEMPQRSNLLFGNAPVIDDVDNDITKIDIQNIESISKADYEQLTQEEKTAHPWWIYDAPQAGGVYIFQNVDLMNVALENSEVPDGAFMMVEEDTPFSVNANDVTYDNASGNLSAINAQSAIDELDSELEEIQEYSTSTVKYGYFNGTLQRYGKIRVMSLYNGQALQSVQTWNLPDESDYPINKVTIGAWLPINESNYGSRYIYINTDGTITISGDVFRGGWIAVWVVN